MSVQNPDGLHPFYDHVVIPILNLLLAFLVAMIVMLFVGKNPFEVMYFLFKGAFGSVDSWGYTLYFATTYIFGGLAVALAFQGKLFNIGGEGQGLMGGIGITMIVLAFDQSLPAIILIPFAILFAMLLGGLWGWIAGAMNAYRNSHIVILTIMLNWIATGILGYLLNGKFQASGGAPESRVFAETAYLPQFADFWNRFDFLPPIYAPLNLSFLLALALCVFYWWYVWRTPAGYELRAVGENENAAKYAGIKHKRQIVVVMSLSGAFAGLMAVNMILGETHSLKTNFIEGAGFISIAVALMGRNRPIGIILAAILFGGLRQGGFDLRFEVPGMSPYIVNMMMGLIIYFSGALAYQFVPFFLAQTKKNALKGDL